LSQLDSIEAAVKNTCMYGEKKNKLARPIQQMCQMRERQEPTGQAKVVRK
jgi:hypothetical protein